MIGRHFRILGIKASISPRTSRRGMPIETAIRRPCNRASYWAALLESVYNIWSTYWTVSPVGDVRTTPTPRLASILEPSKCMIQLKYAPYYLGSSASVHSATKSASTCDLMARRGLYIMSNGRSSIAHLAIRPVASRFFIMSLSGTSEATVIEHS